jgi:hypothetical protein
MSYNIPLVKTGWINSLAAKSSASSVSLLVSTRLPIMLSFFPMIRAADDPAMTVGYFGIPRACETYK